MGGLKGLCGSLAISLAQRGAKHLIVMSRSGVSDQRSQTIVKDCASYACQIHEARGDVASIEDVKAAFASGPYPVRGVVQGAMVLRVSHSNIQGTRKKANGILGQTVRSHDH